MITLLCINHLRCQPASVHTDWQCMTAWFGELKGQFTQKWEVCLYLLSPCNYISTVKNKEYILINNLMGFGTMWWRNFHFWINCFSKGARENIKQTTKTKLWRFSPNPIWTFLESAWTFRFQVESMCTYRCIFVFCE